MCLSVFSIVSLLSEVENLYYHPLKAYGYRNGRRHFVRLSVCREITGVNQLPHFKCNCHQTATEWLSTSAKERMFEISCNLHLIGIFCPLLIYYHGNAVLSSYSYILDVISQKSSQNYGHQVPQRTIFLRKCHSLASHIHVLSFLGAAYVFDISLSLYTVFKKGLDNNY